MTADVLILWHMHQPRYVHPETGVPALPWVRLHAASGYLDMARALERHPGVGVTVNFVPSLVDQIEAMLAGTRDDLERIAEKPVDALDEDERCEVLARSFSVRWDKAIAPRPRYAELLARRGQDGRRAAIMEVCKRFGGADLRDVQCLFLLAWLGWAARQDDPALGDLDQKGRDFSEADKAYLLGAVRGAAAKVLPAWAALAQRGQIELATSPYYHPIIPLLIDTDTAKRARPNDKLPPRFQRPDDAREQILAAISLHERVFGKRPSGMWPPEGSLSAEAVALYGELGVSWLAGDEETLVRSLAASPADGAGVTGPARAQIWRQGLVSLVFRDRDLSDRIGFRYADVPADHAAEDLVAAARASAGTTGLCGIFLDGENAWESFPGRGEYFLDALYGKLERTAEAQQARARTIGEVVRERGAAARPLTRLHSGSWIDADFHIWIGDPVKNRAWALLGRARDKLSVAETVRGAHDPAVVEARRLLLAAEGSDWFWWFGEPFSSAEDSVFDELFRAHLAQTWRVLGDEPPVALREPVAQGEAATARAAQPHAIIRPKLDGRARSFYEWQGAARHEIAPGAVMASGTHPLAAVLVGFDLEFLYVCLEPRKDERRRVATAHMSLWLRAGDHETHLEVLLGAADGGAELRKLGGRVGSGEVVELALPFAALGARPHDELRLWATLEFAGVVLARVPQGGALATQVPWPGWGDENWSV
jgi:alpha-amylase/alpha-mannosidase (GH57 family)